jgi:hypothetical protein
MGDEMKAGTFSHPAAAIAAGLAVLLSTSGTGSAIGPAATAPFPQAGTDGGPACIGVVLPVVEGVEGNASDVGAGVRDLMVSTLAGPAFRIVPPEARLVSQAVEEARGRDCEHVLTTTVTLKRSTGGGGGLFGKVLQGAGRSAAWHVPSGGIADAAASGAAAAGIEAAASLASTTRTKDELRIEYRLLADTGRQLAGPRTERQKARRDGEDLLTPLVRRVAEGVAAAAARK